MQLHLATMASLDKRLKCNIVTQVSSGVFSCTLE